MLEKSYDAYKKNCVFSSDDPKCELYDKGCEGMTFAYLGAMYCQKSIADYAKSFDFVVMNCGHHPAATSHWGYQLFEDVTTNLFRRFKELNTEKSLQLYWLENTAQPLRQDKYTEYYKDWRTYHRLMMFDEIAKMCMSKVPFLRLSYPTK